MPTANGGRQQEGMLNDCLYCLYIADEVGTSQCQTHTCGSECVMAGCRTLKMTHPSSSVTMETRSRLYLRKVSLCLILAPSHQTSNPACPRRILTCYMGNQQSECGAQTYWWALNIKKDLREYN